MPIAQGYIDQQPAKASFWESAVAEGKSVLGGLGKALLSKGTKREVEYSGTSEEVGAGLFDILYEKNRAGTKRAADKAAEKFRGTKFGAQFISSTRQAEIQKLLANPLIWIVGAVVALLVVRGVSR